MQKHNTTFSLSMITLAILSTNSYAQEQNLADVEKEGVQVSKISKVESEDDEIERIDITGSRLIVDPTLTTRSMIVIDKEEIDRSGVGSLDELLKRLPQNVGSNNATGGGLQSLQEFGLGPNVFGASSVNLRGLGAQYTLVLIDGRRPAKGGLFGDVTDISTIPLERIESVEIIFDGAAAIYGSDAIGGVVNIITRKDFDGSEISVQIDETADGGGATRSISFGHTFDLDEGSFSINSSYTKTESINVKQRDLDFTGVLTFPVPPTPNGTAGNGSQEIMWVRDVNGDGDYDDVELEERITGSLILELDDFGFVFNEVIPRKTGLGGLDDFTQSLLTPDQRTSLEGTPNPETAGYSPVYYAALPEYSGQPLSLYDVIYNLPAEASAEEQFNALGEGSVAGAGQSLTPETEQFSVGLDFDYDITEEIRFRFSSNLGRSTQKNKKRPAGESVVINATASSNPFLTSFDYAIDNGLPQEKNKTTTDTLGANLTLEWDMSDDWSLAINGSYAKQESKNVDIDAQFRPGSGNIENITEEQASSFVGTFEGRLQGTDTLSYFDRGGNFTERTIIHDEVNFNDPLLGFNNLAELTDGLFNPFFKTETESVSTELELYVQGRLMTLPAGDVTTNIIVSRREDDTSIGNSRTTLSLDRIQPGVDELASDIPLSLDQEFTSSVNSIASEISVPVIGEKNSVAFAKSLSFHGAVRFEDVNYFEENANNWSVGLNYQPNDWAILRVNRSASTALPSPQLALAAPRFNVLNTVLPFEGSFDQVPLPNGQRLFALVGGSDNLGPEKNDNLQVSLQLEPTDNIRFTTTYSVNNTNRQVSTPGTDATSLTLANLEEVNKTPYFVTITADTLLFGRPITEYTPQDLEGNVFSPRVGDFLSDERNYNIRSTDVTTLDFILNWNSGITDYGEFFVTWSHNRALKHEIIQNNECVDNQLCVFNIADFSERSATLGVPVDIIGSINRSQALSASFVSVQQAIPEDRGQIRVDWGYKGLTIGLATNYSSSTDVINSVGEFNEETFESVNTPYIIRTTPAIGLDVNVSYAFGEGSLFKTPEWLDTTTLFFNVNDLIRRDDKIEIVFPEGEPSALPRETELNAAALSPRGTAFSLRLRTTF